MVRRALNSFNVAKGSQSEANANLLALSSFHAGMVRPSGASADLLVLRRRLPACRMAATSLLRLDQNELGALPPPALELRQGKSLPLLHLPVLELQRDKNLLLHLRDLLRSSPNGSGAMQFHLTHMCSL